MSNFLVFAGTTEGRRLIELLYRCGVSVCASVATGYGRQLLPDAVKVFADRLDQDEMATMLQNLKFDCVIDATHPYADEATRNICQACEKTRTRYLRIDRPSAQSDGCVYVEDARQAVDVLSATTGNVLLTTGSKDLDIFACLPDFQKRLYPRVLPALESLERCLTLGYPQKHIIAMQGPFSREMNLATLREIGAGLLVTKDSGETGGFPEKLAAAQDAGATVIVISRPSTGRGMRYREVVSLLTDEFGLRIPDTVPEELL